MSSHGLGKGQGELDAARGRADPPEELRRHLGSAPAPYLEGALSNPHFHTDELVLLVRNPSAGPAVLTRIGRNTQWTRLYEVKKALVRNPRTPVPLARRFLPHLLWLDLSEVPLDSRLSPVVRRQAEEVLKVRIDEMQEGELVALARRASRGVIPVLAERLRPRVVHALLGNAKLVERDVLRIASEPKAPSEVLAVVAEHPHWGIRLAVRLALLMNPRTPVRAALHVVAKLPRVELERVAGDGRVPQIVRVGAGRRLERASDPTAGRRG